MSETIFAVASGFGSSAVAIIRISGSRAWQAVARMCGVNPNPREATLVGIHDPVTLREVDRSMILWFPGPASFTGEDSAEFHIHGGLAIKTCVLRGLAKIDGFRPAAPGEFTRRAFLNGKMDLYLNNAASPNISNYFCLKQKQNIEIN